jgi:hypothetical protein
MLEDIKKKENDLKVKADLFYQSVNDEFGKFLKDSSILTKVAIFGGGAALIYYLATKLADSRGGIIDKLRQSPEINDEIKAAEAMNANLKNQFVEKITIIGLEILRQTLITLIDKLPITDGKKDI